MFSFRTRSPQVEQREFYIPLGPRDTFPFIPQDIVSEVSTRPYLINLAVRPVPASHCIEGQRPLCPRDVRGVLIRLHRDPK